MQAYKKLFVAFGLLAFIITGIAATTPPQDDEHFTNLKVLPKNTSGEEMDRIMYGIKRQLGVSCLYCHVPKKDAVPKRMDFASDEKREKGVAREMMKMSIKINKKYFDAKDNLEAFRKPKVWCRTCHHGRAVIPSLPKV